MATATPLRRPAPAARPVARPAPGRAAQPVRSSGYRGEEGIARMHQEQEASKARRELQQQSFGMPFRYFLKPGTSGEIIVVDDKPDFFRFEHNTKDLRTGKWNVWTQCIAETDECPVCLAHPDKYPYFAMFLTIIDLTPYVSSEGVEIPWTKKLLVVKQQQQKKIMRLYERLGSLRGAVLQMTRDGDKDASIGGDIEYVDTAPEEELAEYFRSYTDKDGKQHDIVGAEAFNYDELFPEQTAQMLSALVGGAGGITESPDAHDRAIGRTSRPGRARPADNWEEPAPSRAAVRPGRAAAPAPVAPTRRAAAPAAPARPVARRAAAPQEPEYADEAEQEGVYEEEQEQAPPPRRGAAPARQAQPQRLAPRQQQIAPEDDPSAGAEEEQYEDPPQRSRAAPPRGAAPVRNAAPTRGAAPAQSMVDRRRMLRGG